MKETKICYEVTYLRLGVCNNLKVGGKGGSLSEEHILSVFKCAVSLMFERTSTTKLHFLTRYFIFPVCTEFYNCLFFVSMIHSNTTVITFLNCKQQGTFSL